MCYGERPFLHELRLAAQGRRSKKMWFSLELRTVAGGLDLLTGRLAELGHRASEVIEDGSQGARLLLYIEADDSAAAERSRAGLLDSLAGLTDEIGQAKAVAEQLWTENWKAHFEPLLVGRRLAVVAPWHEAGREAPGRTAVVIDPGMAFGTGHHETTHCCLELVDRYTRDGITVADIGCGSGVLAIAALKLGARRALATDTDPVALDVARRNAVVNGVAERLDIEAAAAAGPPGRFDLVLANIVAETLVELAPALAACLAPGGRVVLSGIESGGAPLVQGAFRRLGARCIEELERGSWTTLVLVPGSG